MGIPVEQLGGVVAKYPTLLGLSVDRNLRPKLEFLRDEVKVHRLARKAHAATKDLMATSHRRRRRVPSRVSEPA